MINECVALTRMEISPEWIGCGGVFGMPVWTAAEWDMTKGRTRKLRAHFAKFGGMACGPSSLEPILLTNGNAEVVS